MAKKNIEIRLIADEENISNNVSALVNGNIIRYIEDNVSVTIKKSNDYITMIRENNEYRLTLKFNKNRKEIGKYLLKDNNMLLNLEILTKELIIDKNKIYILYELNEEYREFELSIKEWFYDSEVRENYYYDSK